MEQAQPQSPAGVVQRLVGALNRHDVEGMVACFAADYRNDTPAHPRRSFHGREQVRRNWVQLFAGVPDIRARVLRSATSRDGGLWTEWEMSGTRADGSSVRMCGVVIFTTSGALITAARFYLEPVEDDSGDVDDHTRRVAGVGGAGRTSHQPSSPSVPHIPKETS